MCDAGTSEAGACEAGACEAGACEAGACEAGTALVEAVVAALVLAVGVTALVQVSVAAARSGREAEATATAARLAAQKVEELRALAFGVDADGVEAIDRMSDTTIDPDPRSGGPGLTPSPPDALTRDVRGYVDYVDERGRKVAGRERALFVRRWSIEIATTAEPYAVLQVAVVRRFAAGAGPARGSRLPGEARILTVRRRGVP